MEQRTARIWTSQAQQVEERWNLFKVLSRHIRPRRVLYPGSYVDIAPSFVFADVTYLDVDQRAATFFSDPSGVLEVVRRHASAPKRPAIRFVHGDYRDQQPLDWHGFDLLISLYSGFISMYCVDHLAVGGHLLVNPSHGDAALAMTDERYRLSAAVEASRGSYQLETVALDGHLVPKRPADMTREKILASGRAVACRKTAFAYLFQRVR